MFIRFIGNLVLCIILLWIVQGAPTDLSANGECLRNAKSKEVLQYMNESVDPCDNFYNFACGNYHKFQKLIDLEGRMNTLYLAYRDLNAKVVKLLTTDDENETDIDRKVKSFYQSCINFDIFGVTFTEKIKVIIGEFGEMPALESDKCNGDDFDWLKSIGEISHEYGLNIIMDYKIIGDFLNNTMPRMALLAPQLGLGKPALYLEEAYERNRQSYRKSTFAFLRRMGITDDIANKTAKEIVDFEISLAKGMLENEVEEAQDEGGYEQEEEQEVEEEEKEENKSTEQGIEQEVKEIQTKYTPDLDLKKWLRISLGFPIPDEVYFFDREYFWNLATILNNTPKAVQANYIFYKLARYFITFANDQKTWEAICFHRLKTYFSPNLYNMVYRKYGKQDAKQAVRFVWHQIQSTFERNMQSSPDLDWISNETRKKALEKLDAMSVNIMSYDQYNFTQEFDLLHFTKDDYIANLQSSFASKSIINRSKLTKPFVAVDQSAFGAVFVKRSNSVQVPVVYLLPNYFWSHSYPNAVNFGNLGFTLGHEVIHGFDNTGRYLDKAGVFTNWWDDKSLVQFLDGKECFRNQYKNYIFNGQPLADKESQDEDIADNSGIRLAYKAYLDWYENNFSTNLEELESLPGLKYDNKQLFFIAFAQSYCTIADPAQSKSFEDTDLHTPEEFRVIGSLSNLEEFSQAFNCPSGSAMNPAKKCKIY